MSDVARIVSRYGIPVTGWQHDGGLESRLFAVFRLIARAAGLYPAADPRQIYKQAKLIDGCERGQARELAGLLISLSCLFGSA